MKVYVAAASSDIERAKTWMDRLRCEDIEVTSDWPEVVEAVGEANPREASPEERAAWAAKDLRGVLQADVFWFLVPESIALVDGVRASAPARGAYWEAGAAYRDGKELVFSGDTKQSIFCALSDYEFQEDRDAFECICWLARRAGRAA